MKQRTSILRFCGLSIAMLALCVLPQLVFAQSASTTSQVFPPKGTCPAGSINVLGWLPGHDVQCVALPTSACVAPQVLSFNGLAFYCATGSGTAATIPTCTGSDKALQWNGTAWSCVSISAPAGSNCSIDAATCVMTSESKHRITCPQGTVMNGGAMSSNNEMKVTCCTMKCQ